MSLAGHPHRHVPLTGPGLPRQAQLLELAAPLALGQRGLVVAPPRAGATTVLGWIGRALADAVGPAAITVLLVDCDVEEQLEWRSMLPGACVAASATDSGDPMQHVRLAEHFEAQRARCDAGEDVAILVDSFSTLARACVAISDPDDPRILDGGMPQLVLRRLRTWFSLAHARDDDAAGTLTIVGTLRADAQLQLDEVLLHELVGTGNVEWRLNADVARAGIFPPLDLIGSGARRTELILGTAEADRRASLRAAVDQHGPTAGLGLLELQIDELGSLAALLDSLG